MKDPLEESTVEVTREGATRFLAVFVAALVALAVFVPGSRIPLAIVVGIVIMVMLHEAGHYIMAKRAGMKVTEFFLGFGPRIWSFRKGETEYGLKAIPAGAYVRIIGMHNLDPVAPEDEPRAFYRQPAPQRAVVLSRKATLSVDAMLNGVPTLAAPVKMSAAGSISILVATGPLTAGVIEIFVYYVVASNA
jgi:membrane-associated protease RseP (regulator of RpoE activity)